MLADVHEVGHHLPDPLFPFVIDKVLHIVVALPKRLLLFAVLDQPSHSTAHSATLSNLSENSLLACNMREEGCLVGEDAKVPGFDLSLLYPLQVLENPDSLEHRLASLHPMAEAVLNESLKLLLLEVYVNANLSAIFVVELEQRSGSRSVLMLAVEKSGELSFFGLIFLILEKRAELLESERS